MTTTTEKISSFVAENITGRLDESEKPLVVEAYTGTVNAFLRHEPIHRRAELVKEMLHQTSDWVKWENPLYAQARMLKVPFGKNTIDKPRGFNEPQALMHEGVHYLQELGIMSKNNALTFAVTRLVSLENGEETFFDRGDGNRIFRGGTVSAEQYLSAVLNNKAHTMLIAPWALKPESDIYPDKYTQECAIYLANEDKFNLMFEERGEIDLPKFMGIENPYTIMGSVGSARGNRAYALGYFTGDMRNAWTVLWLHGQGMEFEEAEQMVARAYLNGTIEDFNNYPLLKAQEVHQITSMESVFRTRKLDPLELEWVEVEQETGVCVFGKVRQLITDAGEKANLLVDALKATIRNIREMDPKDVVKAQEVYAGWAGNHFYRDSLTGKPALDLTELKPYLENLVTESYNHDAEYSGNIFVFPNRENYPTARILGTRKGFAMMALPMQYSKQFPENIGTAHAHYYAEYSGQSITDLVEFATHQGHFISVVASTNGIYVLTKTPDFDSYMESANRHAVGAGLWNDYVNNLRQDQPTNELDFVIAKARELGMGAFALEDINNLGNNEALILTEPSRQKTT